MTLELFSIDLTRVADALLGITLLSFFIERALALPFESCWLVRRISKKGVKEPISFAVAFLVVRFWDFDAISLIFAKERTELWGHLLTAAIVAGGSKASVKLFHDVMGVMSSAEAERQAVGKTRPETPP